ncbi:CIA30 family protein [Trichloromonas sp.]|uniref:CIA30 family protein n=1 Tax=Trichloromonas sp. TaxID=3069249 RepID=UPI003D812D0D
MNEQEPIRTLFDFTRSEEIRRWQPVNDMVMGGRSESLVEGTEDGAMVFAGRVSFENGGGFASIRSQAGHFETEGAAGLLLTLRGDGKRYKISVRCDRAFDGVSYQTPLPTSAGVRQTFRIPWSALRPSYHGQQLTDLPPLDPARIRRFGILIADHQEGPFRLEIYRIETCQEEA